MKVSGFGKAMRWMPWCLLAAVVGACSPYPLAYQPVLEMNGERQPLSAGNFHERGVSHLRMGRLGLALHDLRRALMKDPTSVETLNAIGVSYDELQRYDVARRYYERGLALQPDSVQTLNNLARSLLRQGKPERALVYLERASRADKANAVVATNLRSAERELETLRREAERKAADPSSPRSARRSHAAWIERSSGMLQTLVTRPPHGWPTRTVPDGVEPRSVSIHGMTSVIDGADAAVEALPERRTITAAPWRKAETGVADSGAEPSAVKGRSGIRTPRSRRTAGGPGREPRTGGSPKHWEIARHGPAGGRIWDPFRKEGVTRVAAVIAEMPDTMVIVPEPLISRDEISEPVAATAEMEDGTVAADDNAPTGWATGSSSRVEGYTLEVSNGAGRRHVAARMARYLLFQGFPAARLTNADRFSYRRSILFYRPGFEAAARRLSESLPAPVPVVEQPDQRDDVRLRLGGDLLELDRSFLIASRGT